LFKLRQLNKMDILKTQYELSKQKPTGGQDKTKPA